MAMPKASEFYGVIIGSIVAGISLSFLSGNSAREVAKAHLNEERSKIQTVARMTGYPEISSLDSLARETLNATVDSLDLEPGNHTIALPSSRVRTIDTHSWVTPGNRTYTIAVIAMNSQDPEGVPTLLVSVPSSSTK